MAPPEPPFTINPVGEPDLDELLLLVRAYCDSTQSHRPIAT